MANPIESQVETMPAGDQWLAERKQFRRQNLAQLRAREGLIEGGYDVVVTQTGRTIQRPFQTGKVKLDDSFLTRDEDMETALLCEGVEDSVLAGRFDLVVHDPDDLARELADLERDQANLARSEMVRHHGVPVGFTLSDDALADEEKLDEWMLNHLKWQRER